MSGAAQDAIGPLAAVASPPQQPQQPGLGVKVGRAALLAVIAGVLLLRQDFAHRNLGEIPRLWGGQPWAGLKYLYVTELLLLLLSPLAVLEFLRLRRLKYTHLPPGSEPLQRGWGWPFYLALAFFGWGVLHALYAFATVQPRDLYLLVRQSAMAGYALVFVYAVVFFHRERRFVENAAALAFVAALLAAGIDLAAQLAAGPAHPAAAPRWAAYFNTKPYGQETLPIAILGAALLAVYSGSWPWRIFAVAILGFAGWRQGLRFQSVVPVAMAGALGGYLLLSGAALLGGREGPLKRAILVLALFAAAGAAYLKLRPSNADDSAEVHAWSLGEYSDLMQRYAAAKTPENSAEYVFSTRTGQPVADPEVYRLNAVFEAAPNLSVRNNIWRYLVWRRMASDWREGRPVAGAGVGKPWFYPALYHTKFNYGEERIGLDPHNSLLNMLYRFGLIGFALAAAATGAVLYTAWRALLRTGGDVLLEGLAAYFFYTLVFANFTAALEGSPYALPFWFSLGLLYVRARQDLAGDGPHP